MPASDYHLVSHWRVLGRVKDVYDVISDQEELPRWWPAAFLEVLEVEPAGEDGLGAVIRMETRGWLPYKLHWHLRVDERSPPNRLGFHVWGDFEGRGLWLLEEADGWTDVTFDWQVSVHKPLVRYLSGLVKPIFVSNHRWAMAKGEESLRLALARRNVHSEAERRAFPPPPGPAPVPWLGIAAGVGGLALLLLLRRRFSGD
jgi:hypothetical protein